MRVCWRRGLTVDDGRYENHGPSSTVCFAGEEPGVGASKPSRLAPHVQEKALESIRAQFPQTLLCKGDLPDAVNDKFGRIAIGVALAQDNQVIAKYIIHGTIRCQVFTRWNIVQNHRIQNTVVRLVLRVVAQEILKKDQSLASVLSLVGLKRIISVFQHPSCIP